MTTNAGNIILTPVRAMFSAVGTALPTLVSGSPLPVASGASWGVGWTELGYTSAPLTFEYVHEDTDADVQEALAAVKRFRTKEELNIETVLAEFDPIQMANAFASASGSVSGSVVNSSTMDVGGSVSLPIYQWGFEGTYVDATNSTTYPVRIYVYRATGTAGGKLEFGKKDVVGTPLKLKALADTTKTVGSNLFKIEKIVKKP